MEVQTRVNHFVEKFLTALISHPDLANIQGQLQTVIWYPKLDVTMGRQLVKGLRSQQIGALSPDDLAAYPVETQAYNMARNAHVVIIPLSRQSIEAMNGAIYDSYFLQGLRGIFQAQEEMSGRLRVLPVFLDRDVDLSNNLFFNKTPLRLTESADRQKLIDAMITAAQQ